MELKIGKPPILHPDTTSRLVALNNALVRDIQTELKLPNGAPWGSPAITVVRFAVAQALERAAKYGKLEVYEAQRRRSVAEAIRPPSVVVEDPHFTDESTTQPYPLIAKKPNLGDE